MLPFKGLDSFDLQSQLLQSLENLVNYNVFFELDDNQMLEVSHGYFNPEANYVSERQNLYTLLLASTSTARPMHCLCSGPVHHSCCWRCTKERCLLSGTESAAQYVGKVR